MAIGLSTIFSKSKWLIIFQHSIALIVAALALDSGETGIVLLYTLITYWLITALILRRRPESASFFDLFFIRWSFLILFFAGLVVYPYAWHLRGMR